MSDAPKPRGRPPKGADALTAPVVIRMSETQRAKLAALGGGAWIRKRIDRAKVGVAG